MVLLAYLVMYVVQASSEPLYENIAFTQDSEIIVATVAVPKRSIPLLNNQMLTIVNPPSDFHTTRPNCFCFDPDDPRFAYTNSFYYLTKYIEFANGFLGKLGYQKLPQAKLKLRQVPGEVPRGFLRHDELVFLYSDPATDGSVLAHLLGHFIHYHLSKDHPMTEAATNDYEALGVFEGIANIIAALIQGSPNIGTLSLGDVSLQLDKFVRIPDHVPTVRAVYEHRLKSKFFTTTYPVTAAIYRKALAEPQVEVLRLPEPSETSSAVTGPLWLASREFGREKILLLIFETLHEETDYATYLGLANALVRHADNLHLVNFLEGRFKARGLTL